MRREGLPGRGNRVSEIETGNSNLHGSKRNLIEVWGLEADTEAKPWRVFNSKPFILRRASY